MPGPRAPAPAPKLTRQQQAALEKKAETKAKLAIAGIFVLGIGLIYGAVVLIGSLQTKLAVDPYALPPEVVAREKAEREKRAKEAADQKKEEEEERARDVATLAGIFRTDAKVAAQIMQELDGVREDHRKLAADADSNNDPKDITAYYIQRLGERAEANNTLKHWLGGKPGSAIGEFLWGREEGGMAAKGSTPDFLRTGQYRGSGTGFFISSDGWLVTNDHVVQGKQEVDIRGVDGAIVKARVVKTDRVIDLALLKAETTPAASLNLQESEQSLGAMVFTIGFPNAQIQGVEAKFTEGSISSLKGSRDDPNDYQLSVPVQQGNSGGALVDMHTGLVSGVVAANLNTSVAENVIYAVKSTALVRLIAAIPEASAIPKALANATTDRATNIDRVKRATVMVLVK